MYVIHDSLSTMFCRNEACVHWWCIYVDWTLSKTQLNILLHICSEAKSNFIHYAIYISLHCSLKLTDFSQTNTCQTATITEIHCFAEYNIFLWIHLALRSGSAPQELCRLTGGKQRQLHMCCKLFWMLHNNYGQCFIICRSTDSLTSVHQELLNGNPLRRLKATAHNRWEFNWSNFILKM